MPIDFKLLTTDWTNDLETFNCLEIIPSDNPDLYKVQNGLVISSLYLLDFPREVFKHKLWCDKM